MEKKICPNCLIVFINPTDTNCSRCGMVLPKVTVTRVCCGCNLIYPKDKNICPSCGESAYSDLFFIH